MYINKEDYDIYYNGELIDNIVDIDVREAVRLYDRGVEKCQDLLMVTFLGPGGMLLQVNDGAENFKLVIKNNS